MRPAADADRHRDEGPADSESWAHWFREDFLRSCYVGACLAWLGFGAISIRYALDPYRPNQGAAPLAVYLAMTAFVSASIVGQVYLYRHWWPSLDGWAKPLVGVRRRRAEAAEAGSRRVSDLLITVPVAPRDPMRRAVERYEGKAPVRGSRVGRFTFATRLASMFRRRPRH